MIEGQILLGLTNELKKAPEEVGDNHLDFFFCQHHCDFVFNTPSSSLMSAAWERLIHTVHRLLSGILMESHGR